jgi:hypothetical protein
LCGCAYVSRLACVRACVYLLSILYDSTYIGTNRSHQLAFGRADRPFEAYKLATGMTVSDRKILLHLSTVALN